MVKWFQPTPEAPLRAKTKNLIVISDTHCGCRLGLFPSQAVRLDDGGFYAPSEFQQKLYELWLEFWNGWVPEVTRGEQFDVVHNGDAIDGVHHSSTTQISHNLQDQVRIADLVLRPIVEKVKAMGGTYYHIRGTEAHVGSSGKFEEELAERLGAKPNRFGQFARYDLRKRVGDALVHLLHHIGTTSSSAHESSAVNAELTAEYVEAARWKREPPDYVVRSHRHRYIGVDINAAKGYAAGIVTPAWQGKTPFVWKVPGGRLSEPQVGGIIIRQGDEEHYYRRWVKTFEPSEEE